MVVLNIFQANAPFLSATVRQNESQNRCYKETKHANFTKNEHFLPPDTQVRFEIRPFALLPTLYPTETSENLLGILKGNSV